MSRKNTHTKKLCKSLKDQKAQSDTWYRGLESPDGVFVKAVFYDINFQVQSTVYGLLNANGNIKIGNSIVYVLARSLTYHRWEKSTMVQSVKFLWSEEDYIRIPTSAIRSGDKVVVDDQLRTVDVVDPDHDDNVFISAPGGSVSRKVLYGLRKKPGRSDSPLPDAGMYRDKNGRYWLFNPEDNRWYDCSPYAPSVVPEPEFAPYEQVRRFEKKPADQ